MTKRSHEIASRQAAISRERKRKKKPQTSEKLAESPSVSAPVDVMAGSSSTGSNAVRTSEAYVSTKSTQTMQLDESRYEYVVRDLRKIAIIAAPLIVILIILAFVL